MSYNFSHIIPGLKIYYLIYGFIDKYYHQRKILKYLNNLQKNNLIENFDQIFDVGSHKGEYIKLFLKLNKHVKIQAFEPLKEIYNELLYQFKDNKNINCHNIAIGEKKEILEINIMQHLESSTLSKINYQSKYIIKKSIVFGLPINKLLLKKEKIQVQSIDNIFRSEYLNKIDLLKIDTEGFVYEVLKGCKQSIKNIKLILVELHYSDLYDNHNPEKIHNYLIQNNFKLLKSFKFPFLKWEDRLYLNSF